MANHLDRRVVLDDDPEYKGLYKWSLRELAGTGAIIDADWSPWHWGLEFTATELSLTDGVTIEPDYSADDEDPPAVTRIRQYIQATLRPGAPSDRQGRRVPTYSMFGTERLITEFKLWIKPLEGPEAKDFCRVDGLVSSTMEVDFRNHTFDDMVEFTLYLTPETFQRYVSAVKAAQVDQALLYLQRIDGFYSEWTPGVSTDSIKVLTNHAKDHPVEIPEGCDIAPPRLGKVHSASFSFLRKLPLEHVEPKPTDDDDDDNWLDDEELAETPPDKAMLAAQTSAKAEAQTVALLASLRTAAWAVVALLLLILIT